MIGARISMFTEEWTGCTFRNRNRARPQPIEDEARVPCRLPDIDVSSYCGHRDQAQFRLRKRHRECQRIIDSGIDIHDDGLHRLHLSARLRSISPS
jgi:hypothetical protein